VLTVEPPRSGLAAVATVATIAGFVVQFVGLRALHWSATIIQLGVTLIMTAARAFVRRGLAESSVCCKVREGHEISWLTMMLQHQARLEYEKRKAGNPS